MTKICWYNGSLSRSVHHGVTMTKAQKTHHFTAGHNSSSRANLKLFKTKSSDVVHKSDTHSNTLHRHDDSCRDAKFLNVNFTIHKVTWSDQRHDKSCNFVGTAWGPGPARSAPILPPPASTDNAVNEHYASKCPTISRTTTTEEKKTNGQCDRIKIAIHSQHQRRNITSPTYSLLPLPWHLNL